MLQETKKSARSLLHTIISLGILIGFIGIPIPSRAAALDGRRSIQQQFLQASLFNQGGQKTFWLSTGTNKSATSGYALIAMNDPQRDPIPRLDPDTLEANFHYVSNHFNPKTNNYWRLPAGLYFWQPGKLKVRPDQKITYESNKPKKCFAKIAGSKVSDECFNAEGNYYALGQGSEARAATIAHTQNPLSIPLHPFDDNTWAATITRQPQRPLAAAPAKSAYAAAQLAPAAAQPAYAPQSAYAAAAKPGAQVGALPQGLTISIASSNVMSQGQYEHDFPVAVKKTHMLQLDRRTKLFHAAFQDPDQLAGKDFVMLQEFGLGMLPKDVKLENIPAQKTTENLLETYKKTGQTAPDIFNLQTALKAANIPIRSLTFGIEQVKDQQDNPVYKSVAKEAKSPGIVDLLFNTQKYTLVESISHGGPEGRYLGGIFTFKEHPQVKIGVVSAHIQYDDPKSNKQTKKGQQQINQLITAINRAKMTHADIAGWIVAGDYNINYNNPAKDLSGMTNAGFQDVPVGTNGAGGRLTALGKVQPAGARGPQYPWYVSPEGIDYIWYRGNLQPTANSISIYPAVADQNKRLLTGGNMLPNGTNGNDSGRDFFSDHAIVSATFTLGDGGGAQMPQQASQAFGGGLARQRPSAAQEQAGFDQWQLTLDPSMRDLPADTLREMYDQYVQSQRAQGVVAAGPRRAQMPPQQAPRRKAPLEAAAADADQQIMEFDQWKLTLDRSIRNLPADTLQDMYDQYVKAAQSSQRVQQVAEAGPRRAQQMPQQAGRRSAAEKEFDPLDYPYCDDFEAENNYEAENNDSDYGD